MPAQATLEAFKARLRGELLQANDAGYETARQVYNGMIDRHPRLIVRCANVADVIAAVHFARDNDMLVAVRGGGHNGGGLGTCDDGLVIDLSRMKGIRVDPPGAYGAGRRWLYLGRCGSRYARIWPGHTERYYLYHWCWRTHPGWRDRPFDPYMWSLYR